MFRLILKTTLLNITYRIRTKMLVKLCSMGISSQRIEQMEVKNQDPTTLKMVGIIEQQIGIIEQQSNELNSVHRELLKTAVELNERKFSLEKLTVKYLQETGSLNARSVMEIFQQRYLLPKKGKYNEDSWNDFLHSKKSIAIALKTEFELAHIKLNRIGNIACDLYRNLSDNIHKSVKNSTVIYLVEDRFTPDELVLIQAIAKEIVGENYVKRIKEKDWVLISESIEKD